MYTWYLLWPVWAVRTCVCVEVYNIIVGQVGSGLGRPRATLSTTYHPHTLTHTHIPTSAPDAQTEQGTTRLTAWYISPLKSRLPPWVKPDLNEPLLRRREGEGGGIYIDEEMMIGSKGGGKYHGELVKQFPPPWL